MDTLLRTLSDLTLARATASSAPWFTGALHDAATSSERALAALAGAGRRLGRSPVRLTDEEKALAEQAGLAPPPEGWGLDELGRGALILAAAGACSAAGRGDLARNAFYRGDSGEKQALLRVLAYFPDPDSFLDVARDACRSSVQGVFEAIACENPYPAHHFPEAAFNQMVLKAVFTGVALARVCDLDRRLNPELLRMAEGYASERRAAGRSVPADVERLVAAAPGTT
jgi:hypothetical protein